MIQVERYTAVRTEEWDAFVKGARNGTFLFLRAYMDYHSDRFLDHSLMFFNAREEGKRTLVALLPANECDGVLYSHQGLTYGGLILGLKAHHDMVGEAFAALTEYMRDAGLRELVYKQVPAIYSVVPSQDDAYWLWRMGAQTVKRNVMTVVSLHGREKINTSQRKRNYSNRLERMGWQVLMDAPLADFWPVLEDNLMTAHGAKPVHTLQEIERLKRSFVENIQCCTAVDADGVTQAGVVLYLQADVVKTQYISASAEGKRCHALDFLLHKLVAHFAADGCYRYFDFGTSMLPDGDSTDAGLVAQKEEFGGRTVVCDIMKLKV